MAKTKSFEATIREDICMNIHQLCMQLEMAQQLGKTELPIAQIKQTLATMQAASDRVVSALNMNS